MLRVYGYVGFSFLVFGFRYLLPFHYFSFHWKIHLNFCFLFNLLVGWMLFQFSIAWRALRSCFTVGGLVLVEAASSNSVKEELIPPRIYTTIEFLIPVIFVVTGTVISISPVLLVAIIIGSILMAVVLHLAGWHTLDIALSFL